MPYVIIIAGPNGAGKSTFARRLLARHPDPVFVNADEIARALQADLTGQSRDMRAARDMIAVLDAHISAGADIMLETTLATRRYLALIPRWRAASYEVDLYYLRLPDPETAVARVSKRVASGGHAIPPEAIRRRFGRSLAYLLEYMPIVNTWYVFDSIEGDFSFVISGENHGS
ncbi:MAG: AAA family ATPase [Hyphomicrobium sp.]